MKNKIAYYPTPNEITELMLNLSLNKEKDILETGFGEGAFLKEIIKKTNFKSLTGIELDEEFYKVQLYKTKKNPKVYLINEDYLNYKFKKNFDLIIGNPPYITNDNLQSKIKEKIKELTGSGEGNIYYAFILKSIELLKEQGELIYILPYDFFYNTYAKKLRETLVKEGYFETIIDLGDLKIFKNAAPETIIFKWIKTKKAKEEQIDIFKYKNKGKYKEVIKDLNLILKTKKENNFFKHFKMFQFKEKENIWYVSNFKIDKKTNKLSTMAKVGVGIVNGSEKNFKITKTELKDFTKAEKNKFIKKFIKAKNLKNYIIDKLEDNLYVFIDNDIKSKKDFEGYENIYEFLKTKKEDLSNRYIPKNKKWWNYLAIRNKEIMDKSKEEYKLIVPNITRKTEGWFSITKLPYYISGDVLMIKGNTEEETFLLFGILNSEYFNKLYKERGAKKGNRIVFNQKILNDFQIPKFEEKIEKEIIEEVKKMLLTQKFNFELINKLIS